MLGALIFLLTFLIFLDLLILSLSTFHLTREPVRVVHLSEQF
jgi:hypothetical protein